MWLERNNLGALVPCFEDHTVTGAALVALDGDILLEMGVTDSLQASKVLALVNRQLIRPRSGTRAAAPLSSANSDTEPSLSTAGASSSTPTAAPDSETVVDGFATALLKTFQQNVPGTPYALRAMCKALLTTLGEHCPSTPTEEIQQTVCAHVMRTYVRPALLEPHSRQLLAESVRLPLDKKNMVERALDMLELFARRRVQTEGAANIDERLAFYTGHGKTLAVAFHQLSHPRLLELQYGIDEFSDAAQLNRPTIFVSPSDLLRLHRLLAAHAPQMPQDVRRPLCEALAAFGRTPSANMSANVSANMPASPAPRDAKASEDTMSTAVLQQHPAFRWAADEVSQWLGSIGLGQYAKRFEERRITGEELLSLSAQSVDTMVGLGIRKDVHQRQLAKELDELRKQPRRASSVSLTTRPTAARSASQRTGCDDATGTKASGDVPVPTESFVVPTLSELGIVGDRAKRPMALQLVNR